MARISGLVRFSTLHRRSNDDPTIIQHHKHRNIAPPHNEFLQSCAPESRDIQGNSSPQPYAAMQCSLVNISWITHPLVVQAWTHPPHSTSRKFQFTTSNSEARTTSMGLSLFLCCALCFDVMNCSGWTEAPARSGNTPQSDAASAPVITDPEVTILSIYDLQYGL